MHTFINCDGSGNLRFRLAQCLREFPRWATSVMIICREIYNIWYVKLCKNCEWKSRRQNIVFPKQIIHIISFEPITSKASANSFHELSMTSVSIDVIGEFWRATKRELVDIVWIVNVEILSQILKGFICFVFAVTSESFKLVQFTSSEILLILLIT